MTFFGKDRVLVIGSEGLLGKAVVKEFSQKGWAVKTTKGMDFTDQTEAESEFYGDTPHIVVNCARTENIHDMLRIELNTLRAIDWAERHNKNIIYYHISSGVLHGCYTYSKHYHIMKNLTLSVLNEYRGNADVRVVTIPSLVPDKVDNRWVNDCIRGHITGGSKKLLSPTHAAMLIYNNTSTDKKYVDGMPSIVWTASNVKDCYTNGICEIDSKYWVMQDLFNLRRLHEKN